MGTFDANPITSPQGEDIIYVGGIPSPGRVDVRGFVSAYKWDVKSGPGVDGATQTYRGSEPHPGKLKFYLWDPLHFGAWEQFKLLFRYRVGVPPIAVDVYHPALDDIGIKSIVTNKVHNREHSGGGLFTIEVEATPWQQTPPVNVTGTISTASANAGGSKDGKSNPFSPPPDLQARVTAAADELKAALNRAKGP